MKKRIVFIISVLFLLAGCGKTEYTNEVVIEIPGVGREYDFFVLNDTHFFIGDDEVDMDYNALVCERINQFSLDGVPAAQNFEKWISELDTRHLDGIILNGDIIDQLSFANLDHVRKCMEGVNIPWMYLQSDHDLACDWTNPSEEDFTNIADIQEKMNLNEGIYFFEEDEFVILGLNYSWMSISEETLSKIKDVWALGKPIILISHVPFEQKDSLELSDISKELKNGQSLLWGYDDYYYPNEYMAEFMNMIYAEDSPIVAVISAHLHTAYEGMLDEKTPVYILDTGYGGTKTLLRIVDSTEK